MCVFFCFQNACLALFVSPSFFQMACFCVACCFSKGLFGIFLFEQACLAFVSKGLPFCLPACLPVCLPVCLSLCPSPGIWGPRGPRGRFPDQVRKCKVTGADFQTKSGNVMSQGQISRPSPEMWGPQGEISRPSPEMWGHRGRFPDQVRKCEGPRGRFPDQVRKCEVTRPPGDNFQTKSGKLSAIQIKQQAIIKHTKTGWHNKKNHAHHHHHKTLQHENEIH